METFIFGHKNPDTDTITSAITYAYLKNQLGNETKPYKLGPLNPESEFVLDYFDVKPPETIENVKIQLKDLDYDAIDPIGPDQSIQYAYNYMTKKNIKTLPIVEDERLVGLVTMRDIAMSLIQGDYYKIETSLDNIINDLNAAILNVGQQDIYGTMYVLAYHYKTIKKRSLIDQNAIVIVGDRYDMIEYSIHQRVQLIIITGGMEIPKDLIKKAQKNSVTVVVTPYDSFTTAKYINQVNYVSSIMIDELIVKFNEDEYLDDFKEEIQNQPHSNYPIVNDNNEYLGIVSRRHILNPGKKNVILVDHNEYSQSVDGLEEANILEIVDHHKLGDISTSLPIAFRNMPYGSTNTIIYQLYKENDVEISEQMAGLMISGIISDTLLLKSPTTTSYDIEAVNALKDILDLSVEDYAMEMFKEGTSLKGQSIEEIFFKDFKEFQLAGHKVGIAQVFTLDFDEIQSRKKEFIDFIARVHHDKDHFLTLILVTDILKEGSYLLFESDNRKILSLAFDHTIKQADYVEGLVSRKKQVIPKLMKAINILD